MNALEQHELEDLQENPVEQNWSINDLNSATWAMRKIAALEAKNKEIKDSADLEIDRIREWKDKETAANYDSINFFKANLGFYLERLREEDPKARVKTPYGTVSTRNKQPSWEFTEASVEELERLELTDLVRVKKEVDKTALKKSVTVLENGSVVTDDGEILESVKVVPQGETIVVKVDA